MANTKEAFGTTGAFTITLASLANDGVRESTAIDNSSNLFFDAYVYLAIKLGAGSPASLQCINVYFYGSHDGSNYTDNATGSDAAVTLRSPTNLRGPFVISTPAAGALTYKSGPIPVAQYFGGTLPYKWGIVVENKTNIAFDSTEGSHTKQFRGIYATGA